MKHRYLVCHINPNDYGSSITWRGKLEDAKAMADSLAKPDDAIGVWDTQEDQYVYRTNGKEPK